MSAIFKACIVSLCFAAILAGCDLFKPEISSDPVSGTIAGDSFTFVSGYAGPNTTDSSIWIVYLFPKAPATGMDPWDAAAYEDVYPYLDSSFKTSLVPGEFTVSTYAGAAKDKEIGINGWVTSLDNILFDSGTLIIDEFDLTNGKVSGKVFADTRNESSTINGTFEVSVDPANRQ